MVWRFLVVYIGDELSLPLTVITSLITINAVANLISSLIAGSITDIIGRKWTMVIGLVVNGAALAAMNPAQTYLHFAILMVIQGAFRPL